MSNTQKQARRLENLETRAQGAAAYEAGRSLQDNPTKKYMDAYHWAEGWKAAQRDRACLVSPAEEGMEVEVTDRRIAEHVEEHMPIANGRVSR